MELIYTGAKLDTETVDAILKLCEEYKLLPSYVITLKHFEALWGNSEVARTNNNLGGMTWTGESTRSSGVNVERGSARPANEGGYYIKYATIDDYFTDWGYLLRPGGSYRVSGAKTFNDSVRGMFKYGGAKYDYATMGVNDSKTRFEKYLNGMITRRSLINKANNYALDQLDKDYLGGLNMSVSATTVMDMARRYIGTAKYSAGHQELLSKYNAHTPLARGTRMTADWDWCAHFVSTIGILTGQEDIIAIREISVGYMKQAAEKRGLWKGRIRPLAGDIIIFKWNGKLNEWADHVGLVEKVNGDTITTIEGNTGYPNGSFVGRNTFKYNDYRIVGYIRPRYGTSSAMVEAPQGDGQVRYINRHFVVEADSLRVFNKPLGDMRYHVEDLKKGEIKNIDQSIYINGYKWVSYVKYSGERVYTTWQTIDGKRQFGELRDGLVELNNKPIEDDKDERIEIVDKDHKPSYALEKGEFMGYDGTIYVVKKKE